MIFPVSINDVFILRLSIKWTKIRLQIHELIRNLTVLNLINNLPMVSRC